MLEENLVDLMRAFQPKYVVNTGRCAIIEGNPFFDKGCCRVWERSKYSHKWSMIF